MKTSSATIWDFVKELLHEHDCVIVPGFGGFVCNLEFSRIDQVSHLITPPAKHLVFNQNLKTNDGLLANRISEKLKINYSDAIRMIDENVAKTIDVLQDKKMLVVDFFGSFRLNAEANYVFLPDKQNNFLYASYGLMPLLAEPVAGRMIKTSKAARIFKDRKQVRAAKNSKRRRSLVRVLATTFVLLLAVNFYIFIKQPEFKISETTMSLTSWFDSLFNSKSVVEVKIESTKPLSLNTEDTASQIQIITPEPAVADTSNNKIEETAIVTPPAEYNILTFAENLSAAKANTTLVVISENADQVVTVDPNTTTSNIEETKEEIVAPVIKQSIKLKPSQLTIDSSFYIIGGVFCKEKNAKRFLQQLEEKGFSPEIIVNERVNCNRVSYAKYTSRKDAEQQLRTIHASINPDAWLFVKHN
jgi:nucleoid DNA-binding protein